MDSNFALLLSAFFTAGSLGFINYIILEKLGVIILKKSNEQDKKHYLLFFSLFNYTLYLLIFFIISVLLNVNELLAIAFSIVATLILTALLCSCLFPKIALKFNEAINYLRARNNLSSVEHNSPRNMIFDTEKSQSVFIFDFNKELITSGYLESYSNDSDYYEITVVPFDEEPNLDDFSKVKKYSENNNGLKKDIVKLIDFEKKVQYFVITDKD